MGLIAYLHRRQNDPGHPNSRFWKADEVCVVNISGPSEPRENLPAAMLDVNALGNPILLEVERSHATGYWVPRRQPECVGPMFDGTYVATSDSRFGDAVRSLAGHPFYGAVPVHDRWEES